jgi:thymidylate synthase ThyX
MAPFLSPPPRAQLINSFERPFDNAVATARTCYSSRGIITAEMVAGEHLNDPEQRARALARRDALAKDIFQAGHHTTFQHAHFQFALSNVSRQFIWTFLHSHPFYNSEQVSQRYVPVRRENFVIPDLGGPASDAQRIYDEAVARALEGYERLTRRLFEPTAAQFYDRFPARSRRPDKWEKEIRKKAQEVARYVLPVSTFAYLYHTVSAITLLRYHRLCATMDAPTEQKMAVGAMVDRVLEADPNYLKILEEPIPLEETPEYSFFSGGPALGPENGGSVGPEDRRRFRQEFDDSLRGRISLLVDHKPNNEAILAQSVREVLGLPASRLSDDDAIALVLDPSQNPLFGEKLNLTTLSKLTRTLAHAHYSFRKRLSHTADSQDQRHRNTPGSRPCLPAYLTDEPDYIVPELVAGQPTILEEYRSLMDAAWESIGRLRRAGVPDEMAAYLLPNGVTIRFTESADLSALHHKMAMRLCFNAQEEIWRASVAEALAIREVNPRIGRHLLPPCGLRVRAGIRPWCPEGKRYCGVPVWQYDLAQYERVI